MAVGKGAVWNQLVKLWNPTTNEVEAQEVTNGAGNVHLSSSDVAKPVARSLTVLNESSDLSVNGTPQMWVPTENMNSFTVSASTNSTSGSLDIEYSNDAGATTEAVVSSKTLTSGDAVITSADAQPNGTSPVNEPLFKIFAYFRPKIVGASASSTGTIKVHMRGINP